MSRKKPVQWIDKCRDWWAIIKDVVLTLTGIAIVVGCLIVIAKGIAEVGPALLAIGIFKALTKPQPNQTTLPLWKEILHARDANH